MLILEESIAEPKSIEGIAQRLGVSARHLQREFKREVGVSLQTYARTLRLQYGLWRVVFGSASIASAAEASGFTDAAHFSRVCLQVYGKRPHAFSQDEFLEQVSVLGHRAARAFAQG